jgi:hypothetical protein
MVMDEKIKKEAKLIGSEEISEFCERDFATLQRWKTDFGFPMKRVNTKRSFGWEADPVEIEKWFKDRGVDPKTVNSDVLGKYQINQDRKAGKHKINKELVGINAIMAFTGYPMEVIVSDWTLYDGCPIEKKSGNVFCVDADKIIGFMTKHSFEERTEFTL